MFFTINPFSYFKIYILWIIWNDLYDISYIYSSSLKILSKRHEKSIGATFLNGEHYLVDAVGNLMRFAEDDSASKFIENRLKYV